MKYKLHYKYIINIIFFYYIKIDYKYTIYIYNSEGVANYWVEKSKAY